MKTLLRSTLVADPTDDREAHLENFRLLDASGLGFEQPEDTAIWTFVHDFVLQHHHVPDISTIQSHFERTRQDPIVDRLVALRTIRPRSRGDFLRHLQDKAEDRRKILVSTLLQETADIVSKGVEIKDGKKEKKFLRGPIDAVRFFMEGAHSIVAPAVGSRLSGDVTHDGDDFLREYDRVKNDPLAGIGQFSGIRQIDEAIRGAKRNELWVHAAFTGHLKCVSGDTQIWDLRSGRMCTARGIYESGQLPVVYALDERTQKMVTARVDAVGEAGVRPILRVETTHGRSIRVSENHPFFTPRGWVNADELRPGDWVGTPSQCRGLRLTPFSDAEVAIVGYLLGDGHMQDGIEFTNENSAILQDFKTHLHALGFEEKPEGAGRMTTGRHYACSPKSGSKSIGIRVSHSDGTTRSAPWVSSLRQLLDRFGLWGAVAKTKHVPAELWAADDRQMWLLLSALWSTDGRVGIEKARGRRKARACVWYGSTSRRLCENIQAILQRLGIPSTVCRTKKAYKGEPYEAWVTLITTTNGIARFLTNTQIIGKNEEAWAALATLGDRAGDWVPPALLCGLQEGTRARTKQGGWVYLRHAVKRKKIQRETALRLARAAGDEGVLRVCQGDVRWEQVRAVIPDGEEMTYDVSVPVYRNFVANGFITHNSSLMLSWAYNQAIWYGHSSLIFSLEMPYNHCRRLLYAIHSQNERFSRIHPPLDYVKVRDGQLSDKEERFLREHVVPDLNQNPNYGSLLIEVADPEKTDFTVADIRSRAETLYAKTPFSTIFVDHALLVAPRHWVPSTTERLNEVIRDCKKLAMGFNKGQGMATVLLFQISREGFRAALKARQGGDGKMKSNNVYNLTFLSYANECLVGSTPIITKNGHVPIASVQQGDAVWSSTGWKTVLRVFDQGERPTWDVETDRGARIEATEDHRVRVIRDGRLAWAEVSDLQGWDWVVGPGAIKDWPVEPPALPHRPDLDVPAVLSVDAAYVLGAWHGDGRERVGGVAFTGNRQEVDVEARIARTFLSAFGRAQRQYHWPSRPNSFDMESYGKVFRDWFCSFAGEHHGEEVPSVIFRAPRAHVVAFLQGLFDTDGWINVNGVVGLKMKSRTFLAQVQQLLTAIGCDSVLKQTDTYLRATRKRYEAWTLRLRGWDSRALFARDVGFTDEVENQRLHYFVKTRPVGKSSDQTYPVGDVFLSLCDEYTPYKLISHGVLPQSHYAAQWRARHGCHVSRGVLVRLLTYLDSIEVADDRTRFLHLLLDSQVARVSFAGSTGQVRRVYDIEVGGDHEYASGPIFSHNCERSADVVTSTWLDEELSSLGQVLVQCLKSRDQRPFEPFLAHVSWASRYIQTLEDPTVEDMTGVTLDLADV